MLGRTFPEMPRAQVVAVVVRKAGEVSAEAMAAVRSAAATVNAIPLLELRSQLASPEGISLGVQALHRATSLQASLAALGFLAGQNEVETVRLLRDYLAWERQPMLRRRAEAIVRRMEATLV